MKARIAIPLSVGALVTALAVPALGTTASAANECLLKGYGYATYDYVQAWLPAGTCKYGSASGKWDVNGQAYYSSANKRDMQPNSSVYVGYSFPASYDLTKFGWCSDTASYTCITSNWQVPNS